MPAFNEEHLKVLTQGVRAWNEWRRNNPHSEPLLAGTNLSQRDLRGANLRGADLQGANLRGADFSGANLGGADLSGADLRGANLTAFRESPGWGDMPAAVLREANLSGANLSGLDLGDVNLAGAILCGANLSGAEIVHSWDYGGRDFSGMDLSEVNLSDVNLRKSSLRGANLYKANLSGANLSLADLNGADLRGANLSGTDLSGRDFGGWDFSDANLNGAKLYQTVLVGTNFTNADLSNCAIYGVAAWNLNLDGANQSNLIITPPTEPVITVDNLQVAQFIYLLLNNENIRHVIDTITSKVVLILGRFTPERKVVLDALREELRERDYLPIVFDFDKPATRDTHETITTLARMARFVIADISEAESIPQELVSIVEQLPSLPVQPILREGDKPWGMYDHIRRYPWVLEVRRYGGLDDLLLHLRERVLGPVEAKVREIQASNEALTT